MELFPSGFTGDGLSQPCIGINECALGLHDCHSNATCQDLLPGYMCTCDTGFFGNGTNVSACLCACVPVCLCVCVPVPRESADLCNLAVFPIHVAYLAILFFFFFFFFFFSCTQLLRVPVDLFLLLKIKMWP